MNCRDIRALNAQNPHDPTTAKQVADHLISCPMCADELGELPVLLVAPTSAIPPPNLAAKIMARLPATPAIAAAAERRLHRRRAVAWGAFVAALTAILLIGAYGVLVDSSTPAQIFGGIQSALGRGILALTLAGKPMIAAFGALGLPLILGTMVLAGICMMAWRRLAVPSMALLTEVER